MYARSYVEISSFASPHAISEIHLDLLQIGDFFSVLMFPGIIMDLMENYHYLFALHSI